MTKRMSLLYDTISVQVEDTHFSAFDDGGQSVVVTAHDSVAVSVNGRAVTKTARIDELGDPTIFWDLRDRAEGDCRIWQFPDGSVGMAIRADVGPAVARLVAAKILEASGVPAGRVEDFLGSLGP